MTDIKAEVYRQAENRGWNGDNLWYVVKEAIKVDRETQALALEGKIIPITEEDWVENAFGSLAQEEINRTWQQAADYMRAQKITV